MRKILAVKILLTCFFVMLSGCSSAPDSNQAHEKDPFEETNRSVFAFNLAVDDYVLEPAAKGLRALPQPVQTSLRQHVQWTSMPSTALNSTLQGKAENAALAGLNFAINGLTLGFVDLMEGEEQPEPEDFGQTLAGLGVGEGPYLVVPMVGSHTGRSLAGWGVDLVTNPFGTLTARTPDSVVLASVPVSAVSARATYFDTINDVKYNSVDPYARARSAFYQQRSGLLRDNLSDQQEEDAFDSFFFEQN